MKGKRIFQKALIMTMAGMLWGGFMTSVSEAAVQESKLIDATDFKVVDENIARLGLTKKPASNLFDQQDLVPELPIASKLKISGTNWQPVYDNRWGQISFYIDLGAEYFISDIGFMDVNSVSTWTVEAGEPFNWTEVADFRTDLTTTCSGVIAAYVRGKVSSPDISISSLPALIPG